MFEILGSSVSGIFQVESILLLIMNILLIVLEICLIVKIFFM